jgi:hypothetical protein
LFKYIEQTGADVNIQDNDGETPLHITVGVPRQQLPGVRYFGMFQQCFMIVFSVGLAI